MSGPAELPARPDDPDWSEWTDEPGAVGRSVVAFEHTPDGPSDTAATPSDEHEHPSSADGPRLVVVPRLP